MVQRIMEDMLALAHNWAFYIVMILIAMCLPLAFGRSKSINFIGTLMDGMYQLCSYVWETVTEILGAVKTALGFIGALRYIFFGTFSNGVKYIVANYTVLFLIVVSGAMTETALKELFGTPDAVMLSCGLMGGFLLSALWLVQIMIPDKGEKRQRIHYYERQSGKVEIQVTGEPVTISENPGKKTSTQEGSWWKRVFLCIRGKSGEAIWRLRKKGSTLILAAIVAGLCLVISFFDYVYLFQFKVDNLIVHYSLYAMLQEAERQEKNCSEDLEIYYSKIQFYLDDCLSRVRENYASVLKAESHFQDPDPEESSSGQEELNEDANAIETLKAFLQTSYMEFPDSPVQGETAELKNKYMLEFAEIMEWAYAKDIEKNQGGAKRRGSIFFEKGMEPEKKDILDPNIPSSEILYSKEDMKTMFRNYLELTEYFVYTNERREGFFYSSKMESRLRERTADASDEMNEIQKKSTRNGVLEDLVSLVEEYEKIPVLYNVDIGKKVKGNGSTAIPEIELTVIKAPDIREYQKPLKDMYSMLNSNLLPFERAFLSIRHMYSWNSWFLAGILGLSASINILIVIVCFIRGTLFPVTFITRKRKLIRYLFLKEEKADDTGDWKVMMAAFVGAVILWYLGYYFKIITGWFSGAIVALAALFGMILVCMAVQWGWNAMVSRRKQDGNTAQEETAESTISAEGTERRGDDQTTVPYWNEDFNATAWELMKRCRIRLLDKSITGIRKDADPAQMRSYMRQQKEIWKQDHSYTVRPYLSVVPEFQWEIERRQEKCLFLSAYRLQPEMETIVNLLCGQKLAYPVLEEPGGRLTGYVLSKEFQILLMDSVLEKHMKDYGIPHTFEEDLKGYDEDLEK